MSRRHCTVQLHLDKQSGSWWAHCNACHFSAAASSMTELKALVAGGHTLKYRLDLCVDNVPPHNSATSNDSIFEWTWTT